ncbi:MAG: GatB/YqeY domain-containing protein [Candidatus Shapirobacteria bacterium]|jgi:hypothetical protein
MILKDKLKKESVEALKSHDNKRVDVLRFLISLIDKKELQLPVGQMTEAEEIGVLRKELKNKEESQEMFLKANRTDLVEQLDYEIEIVKGYLPQEIDENQVIKIVTEVIAEKGNNFGLVMKEAMGRLNGAVDGSVVSRIVKEKING